MYILLSIQCYANSEEASIHVLSKAFGNVFTDLQAPSFFYKGKPNADGLVYKLSNWKNDVILTGKWDGNDILTFRSLPKGYYTISFDKLTGNVSFGIVLDPSKRNYNPDSFFAMDTGQSWLAAPRKYNNRRPENAYEIVSKLCKLAGVTYVRERMDWQDVSLGNGVYNWGKYMLNANLLSNEGIKISGWFSRTPGKPSGFLPQDLQALYEFSYVVAKTFSGKMKNWEFWNEPDNICQHPIWHLAAAHKAAYLGFKAGYPKVLVPNASLCHHPPNQQLIKCLFENDMADYMDFFNYHVYRPFSEYPKIVKSFRKILSTYNCSEIPIWITENGSKFEGFGKVDSFIKQFKEHDKSQELILAEFTPKSQILMQSEGIAKDFFFVMPAYNERDGKKTWGMLRYDYSIKPSYIAFANLTAQLSNAVYLGKYELKKGIKGFLYEQPDQTQTLVFWSESELDLTKKENPQINITDIRKIDFTLKSDIQDNLCLTDLVGKESILISGNDEIHLTATRYPAYLSGLKRLQPSTIAPIVPNIKSRKMYDKDLSIVLCAKTGVGFQMESRTLVGIKEKSADINLEIYNFSSKNKTGNINVKTNGNIILNGKLDSINIPPFGKVVIPCKCIINEKKLDSCSDFIEFTGCFNNKPISRFKMTILLHEFFRQNVVEKEFNFLNPERWRENSSGDMKISYDANENAVKFQVKFTEDDNYWIYPEYALNEDESTQNAVGISFDIKAQRLNKGIYKYKYLMAVERIDNETGKRFDFEFITPVKEWRHAVVDFSKQNRSGFDISKIKMFRLGMNPKKVKDSNGEELTFWIKNMKVLFPRKADMQ